jgi:hypothetical protein
MKKLLAVTVAAVLSASSAFAQQNLPPPPGQGVGTQPPVSGVQATPPPPPSQWGHDRDYERGRDRDRDDRHHPGTLVMVNRDSLEDRLARMEYLLGEAFERSERGEGRNKLTKAREELDSVRRELAQAPAAYQAPQPAPQPMVQPIADALLQKLVRNVRKASPSKNKLELVEDAAEYNYFTTDQAMQLLPLISFSDDRMEGVRMLWPRILDRQNGHRFYELFKFSSDKKELRELLSEG